VYPHKIFIKENFEAEKQFGVLFSIIFLCVAFYPLLIGGGVRFWSLLVAFVFMVLAYFFPGALYFFNRLWIKIGTVLGAIISPIVMAAVYFLTVFSVGIVMRLLGKDLLRLKLDKNAKSYWLEPSKLVGTMKDQF